MNLSITDNDYSLENMVRTYTTLGIQLADRDVGDLPDEVRLPIIKGVSEIDPFLGRILSIVD